MDPDRHSKSKFGDFFVDAGKTRLKRHVHELGLGVHLETAADRCIDLVLNRKGFACVLGVGLECAEHFALLSRVKFLC